MGALYDLYAPALFTTVTRFLGSRADAEDVVHDVFVGLPEALRAYDEQGRLEAWLARVAIRRAMMHRRSALRRREEDIDAASSVASRSDKAAEDGELLAAVQRLPDTLRHVLNSWGTPAYYVLDEAGRIRFDATSDPDELLARAEGVRLSGVMSAAGR